MVSPTMPLWTILFIIAVYAIAPRASATRVVDVCIRRNPIFPDKYTTEIVVISIVLIGLLSANLRFLKEVIPLRRPYHVEANQRNVNTAIVLNQLTTRDATVGVFWAGTIPYFTDNKAIDFLGKSDKYIANLAPDTSGSVSWLGMNSVPGHNKYDLNYSIKTVEPTYVQGFKWGSQDLSQWAKSKYVNVKHHGVRLSLLRDSPSVFWGKIDAPNAD
jgi:hypothetical protein